MYDQSRKKQLRIKGAHCAGIEKRRRDREKKRKRRRGEGEGRGRSYSGYLHRKKQKMIRGGKG